MTGRRGFLSGLAKTATLGGAAVLLPREAMSELRKHGELREAAEEVYIEESYELGPEQVMQLMARIKELEGAIANPPWFQGKQGQQGYQGPQGLMGDCGMPGRDGVGGLEGIHFSQDPYGQVSLVDSMGNAIVMPPAEVMPNVQFIDANSRYDGYVDKHMLITDGDINELPTCKQVDRLQDCVDYLMEREHDQS